MKSAARLKFTATGAASGTSASALTVSAAITGFRTLATAIADDAAKPNGIVVSDTNVPFTSVDSSGNWETSRYTVSSTTVLTRTRVLSSSAGGTTPAVFNGGALTVFHDPSAEDYSGGMVDVDDVGFDIVLLLGQSNMAGRGTLDAYVDVTDSRVFQWGTGGDANTQSKITRAQDPMPHIEGVQAGNMGMGVAFGRAYAASVPAHRNVLLVASAMGSTGLCIPGAQWAPSGGNLYTAALSAAQAALAAAKLTHPNSRIVGAIWAQGEADADAAISQATYASTLKTLIANFRSTLAAPNMWFVIAGMVPEYIAGNSAGYTPIQSAHIAVAAQTDHCAYVPGPTGYSNGSPGIHYLAPGYRILGVKAATAVQAARRYLAPVVNASAVVISPSPASVVVNNPVTVNVTTDNPLTGSQTQQITMTATITGTWSPSNVVNLSSSTASAAPTFTPTQAGSGNITATVTGTLAISANSPALVSTAVTVSGAPTIGTAVAGNGSASVAFTTPASNGGSAITGYTATSTPGGFTGTGTTSPIAVSGLANGTAYTFTVHATNGIGNSAESAASNSITPSAGATAPGAPTIGTATAGDTTASFPFTAPASTGGAAIDTYQLTVYNASTNASVGTFSGTVSPIGATGLTDGTGYYGKIAAHNSVGYGAQSAASNTVTPVAATTTFTTWSTSATHKATALSSNDNLTVTDQLGSAGAWASIRSVASRSSGKYYFEVTPTGPAAILVGIDDGTTNVNTDFVGQDAGGWGYYNTGSIYHAGGGVAGVTGTAYTTNDTIGVAFDMDNRTIEWFKNGTSIGKTSNATLAATPMYAMVTVKDKSSPVMGFTANFGASAWKYPSSVPTGFVGFA